MLLSKWDEDQRKAVAGLFTMPGWELLKQEFKIRQARLTHDIIYGADREKDIARRAVIMGIDSIFKVEQELFAPPEPQEMPFTIPQPPSGNRY